MMSTDSVEKLQHSLEALQSNADQFFLLVNGIIVFFMQGGFAFLECGSVRSKNTTNILIKNLLESCCAGLSYWIIGYPLAYGSRDPSTTTEADAMTGEFFLGSKYWASSNLPPDQYAAWFFQFVFAATASTIVSGSVAERCEFTAYLVYSFVITGFLYPIVTHWVWHPLGWLNVGYNYSVNNNGTTEYYPASYTDFAGSGAVHVVGGAAAFVAAAFLGARLGRFDDEGNPREIRGHSVPLAALGGFILIFGFFSFNGGSQLSISNPGDGSIVARAVKNSVISGSFAAFTGLILYKLPKLGNEKWSLLSTLNCALAGFVAICAGCNVYRPWSAAIIGTIASICYYVLSKIVLRLRIDDPLDAVAVHFGGGTWGVIAVPFFHPDEGILFQGNVKSGLFFLWQIIGLAAIIGWTVVICIVTFGTLKFVKLLRVSPDIEIKGLDIPKHGEPAYPISAYGHGWDLPTVTATSNNVTNGPAENTPHENPEVLTYNHSHSSVPHMNRGGGGNRVSHNNNAGPAPPSQQLEPDEREAYDNQFYTQDDDQNQSTPL